MHAENGFFGRINDRIHAGIQLEGGFTIMPDAPARWDDTPITDWYLAPKTTFRLFMSKLFSFDATTGAAFFSRDHDQLPGFPPPLDLWGPHVEISFSLGGIITAFSTVRPLFDYNGPTYRETHLQGGVRIFFPIPAIFTSGMRI